MSVKCVQMLLCEDTLEIPGNITWISAYSLIGVSVRIEIQLYLHIRFTENVPAFSAFQIISKYFPSF